MTIAYLYDAPRPGDLPHRAGRVDAALLAERLPADRDVDLYFIGPKPFMRAVFAHALALGVPRPRLHYEFFGPAELLAAA